MLLLETCASMKCVPTGRTRNCVEMISEARKMMINVQAPGCVGTIARLFELMGNHVVRPWLAGGNGERKQDIPGQNSDVQECS